MKRTAILSISIVIGLFAPSSGAAQRADAVASFRFRNMSLRASLDSLMQRYPASIVYLDKDVEGKTVSASCSGCSFEQALNEVLDGTSLMWIRIGNQVILKPRESDQPRQSVTVCGTVTDSVTREWIANASVVLVMDADKAVRAVQRWCPTNSYGFYSLPRLPAGEYTVTVRALGYRSITFPVVIKEGGSVQRDVSMEPEEITMEGVTVEGIRSALTSAEGFSRGLYIRSAPTDQNQYLLDGARIYNPSHFGNVLSAFNPEVLNDVQVLLDGMPPNYGGGIGGILDLSMRDGTMERLSGTAGTGSLGSHLSLEGPLAGSTTFLLSARRAYPDAAVPFLKRYGTPSPLGSSELIGKVSHRLSGGSQLFLSGYLSRDSYNNQLDGSGMRLSNNFSWANSALNLRWIGIATPSLFLHTTAVYTHYGFSLEQTMTGNQFLPTGTPFSSEFAIDDVSVRAHAEQYYDEEHTIRGGVELVHHQITGKINEFSSQTAQLSLQGSSNWELSVYMQDQWKVLPQVTAELGLRATNFTGEKGSFSAIDPRFSLLVSMAEKTRLYTSLTSINQFMHPYRNSGVFLIYPTIFWYPSTDQVRPSTALQLTLGVQQMLRDDAYMVTAESYYRITRNLHEFGIDTTVARAQDLNDVIFFGTGKSYGFEFSLRKRTGDFNGSIGYMLTWGSNTFPQLNGGEPYTPRFDRRHELQLDTWYSPGDGWSFGVLCVLTSDQSPSLSPTTINQATASLKDTVRAGFVHETSLSAELIELSGNRLPGFQRLELKALRRILLWGLPCQFSLRLLNSYGLLDPFIWNLRRAGDVRMLWTASVRDFKIFPLFATMGISVRF